MRRLASGSWAGRVVFPDLFVIGLTLSRLQASGLRRSEQGGHGVLDHALLLGVAGQRR